MSVRQIATVHTSVRRLGMAVSPLSDRRAEKIRRRRGYGSPPREALPPCVLGLAIHPDGRVAGWADCKNPVAHVREYLSQVPDGPLCVHRHIVQAGFADMDETILWHGLVIVRPRRGPRVLDVHSNEDTEAKAAWERAEHWVRTGILA